MHWYCIMKFFATLVLRSKMRRTIVWARTQGASRRVGVGSHIVHNSYKNDSTRLDTSRISSEVTRSVASIAAIDHRRSTRAVDVEFAHRRPGLVVEGRNDGERERERERDREKARECSDSQTAAAGADQMALEWVPTGAAKGRWRPRTSSAASFPAEQWRTVCSSQWSLTHQELRVPNETRDGRKYTWVNADQFDMIMMQPPELLQPEFVLQMRAAWPHKKVSGTTYKYAIVWDGDLPDETEAQEFSAMVRKEMERDGYDGWLDWQNKTAKLLGLRGIQPTAELRPPSAPMAGTAMIEEGRDLAAAEEEVRLASSTAVKEAADHAAADEEGNEQGEEGEAKEEEEETKRPDKFPQRKTNRIVTGFGNERIEDLAAHEQRRDEEGLQRARDREKDFTRGKMVDLHGNELDRSVGTAFRFQ